MKRINLTLLLLLCVQFLHAQSFNKQLKPIISWSSNYMKQKEAKLKNGLNLIVKWDMYGPRVLLVNKQNGFSIKLYEDDESWKKLQIFEYDLDKDGANELFIAYGDPSEFSFSIDVFKITKTKAVEVGTIDNGQTEFAFDNKSIILPFGSQGLFFEYKIQNNKLKEIQ